MPALTPNPRAQNVHLVLSRAHFRQFDGAQGEQALLDTPYPSVHLRQTEGVLQLTHSGIDEQLVQNPPVNVNPD